MYLKSDGGGIWDNTVISDYTAEGVIAPYRMIQHDDHKYTHTLADPPLLYDTTADLTGTKQRQLWLGTAHRQL